MSAKLRKLESDFFSTRTPIAIAHRGGDAAGHAKRNTMAAFASAYKLGYKYMETDVVRTSDGKVIISHGAKTFIEAKLRGTFPFYILQNKTYEQIQKELAIDGEPIPLLEEVLSSFPDVKFFIDAKTDEVVEPLTELITKAQAVDRVAIGSFSYKRIKKVAELMGGWDKICTRFITRAIWHSLRPTFEGNVLEVPYWPNKDTPAPPAPQRRPPPFFHTPKPPTKKKPPQKRKWTGGL